MANQITVVTFAGICTHFRDTIPGVPHRVVVPDASSVRFGTIRIDPNPEPVNYYLLPHLALVAGQDENGAFVLPLNGARLEIVNAIGPMEWKPGGYSITTFVDNFAFSEDVVLGGKAAAYFDVFAGTVVPMVDEKRSVTNIIMETDGPARLRITPFPGSAMKSETRTLAFPNLWVWNGDASPSSEDKQFDFLLNYLVARGGIPRVLSSPTPGMEPLPAPLTYETISRKMENVAELIGRFGQLTDGQVKQAIHDAVAMLEFLDGTITAIPLDQSCSDSHYP